MNTATQDYDAQIDRLGHIAYVIKRAEHTIAQLVEERLRPHGIGIGKYAVLKVLSERPDSSGAQLARRCFVTPQTMSAIIAALAEQGLVARTAHPENLRVQQTRLTDAGHELLRRCQPDIDAVEAAFLSELSAEDQLRLDELLRRGIAGLRELG
ncbi:MAG TPA: MarR family transcriptional regulator [Solirubrobacteraceae bacterium]